MSDRTSNDDSGRLELVVGEIQRDVYGLAVRFLWHPQDAENATQEILVRVITNLGGFRGESGFRTWVYRVACNRLLTLKKKRMELQHLSFDDMEDDLAQVLPDRPLEHEDDIDVRLLTEEVKIGCTLAMLLCLDREKRLAYILGEIMELEHGEAATALEITPAAYRKRLSRARAEIVAIMAARCGLVNPNSPCRCHKRVGVAKDRGRVDGANLLFASSREQARRFPHVLTVIRQLDESSRAAALYRSHPEAKASGSFARWLRSFVKDSSSENGPWSATDP